MKLTYKILIPLILLFVVFSGLLYFIAVKTVDNYVLESKAINLIGSVNKQALVFTDADLTKNSNDETLKQKMDLFIESLADPSIVNVAILDRNMTIVASDFKASLGKHETSMTHDIHEDFADNAIPTWYIDTNQPNLGTLIKILLPLKMSNGKVGYVLEISSATTGTLSAIQQHFTNILILFIVLGLLIISSVYLLIYVQILKPLNSLTKATKIVSDGNLTYKLEINSKDELGILAKAFNSMTLRLNASQFELEEKVKKRTAELEQAKLLNSKFGEQSKLANELEAVKKQLEEHKQEKEQLSKQVDEKDVEITRLKEENDNLKNKI